MNPRFVVSLRPNHPMEENLPPYCDPTDPAVQGLLRRAAGVLLPEYLTRWRYREITRHARSWFPRLDARFTHYGKTRQVELFRRAGVRHPQTLVFPNPSALLDHHLRHGFPWEYPLVLKGDTGGGGSAVFPVYDREDLAGCAERLPADRPLLIQRWVRHGGKDLRVVLYGRQTVSYFRVGMGGFYNNICRGGRLDHWGWPVLQERGREAVKRFSLWAGIDVAGFDLMFPDAGEPVFIEINYHFGRKGLGGTEAHRAHLAQAIEAWRIRCLSDSATPGPPPRRSGTPWP